MSLARTLVRSPVVAPSPPLPAAFPRLSERDSTIPLLREGYGFGRRRFAEVGGDVFTTRVALRPAVFAYGSEAAELLYRGEGLTRRNALPGPTLTLLLDVGSVDMLEGDAHRHRKQLFLSVLDRPAVERLADELERSWRERLPGWQRAGRIVLLDELHAVLCTAVCRWAGFSFSDHELRQRTAELAAMVDGAGSAGARNLRGHVLRARSERAIRRVVQQVRSGETIAPAGSALDLVATHRELDGALLPVDVAAVELLNLLRPTVAVSRFVAFAAHALHAHPQWRERVADDTDLGHFVQEVRRSYPFFPVVGARATEQVEWRGQSLQPGTWVLLDIFATLHDDRLWTDPDRFDPDRFRTWDGSPYDLVPQGAGEHATSHRCPGEWPTIALVRRAVRLLTGAMSYDVPPQDLSIPLSRMPAQPTSGLVLSDVRAA